MPDTSPSQQQFLKDLEKSRAGRDRSREGGTRRQSAAALFNRRTAADKLRANLGYMVVWKAYQQLQAYKEEIPDLLN